MELLTDIDIYQFVESNIRGGLCQISKRYAKANNSYMKGYDSSKIMESILYLDANNLYGHSMSQYLSYAKFKWNKDEWTTEKILDIKAVSKVGYLFEVTLKYPVFSK